MSQRLERYHHPKVVEHLASQYVVGALSPLVHRRTQKLARDIAPLEDKINDWQHQLVGLDQKTPELPPIEQTWANINEQLDCLENIANKHQPVGVNETKGFLDSLLSMFGGKGHQLAHAFSIMLIFVLGYVVMQPTEQQSSADPLSYVAVLTDEQEQAQLVASTYGESQKLVLNIINRPEVTDEEDLELWVVSKTDREARSLGVVPRDLTLVEQQLTNAQWRLIKDSDSLILTVEDIGGSPFGEPSETIVSRGLCVRLQEWKTNAKT